MKAPERCCDNRVELDKQALFDALVQVVSGAAVLTDAQGELRAVNETALAVFKQDLLEPGKRNIFHWFANAGLTLGPMHQTLANGEWQDVVLQRGACQTAVHGQVQRVSLVADEPLLLIRFPSLSAAPSPSGHRAQSHSEIHKTQVDSQSTVTQQTEAQDFGEQLARLTRELQHSELIQQQLATVLHAVGQGILQIDTDGKIIMANKVLLDLFGYQEQELLGLPVEVLLPRAQKDLHEAFRRQYLLNLTSRPTVIGRELWGQHKNGTLIPIEIGLNSIEFNGRVNIVASVTDNTERKRQQKEMLEKTRSLERSNEELRDFAYIATHDLKEPLRGISNYAMFLLEDYESELDDEGKDMIHSIVRLSGRMEQFISELLHFSRVGQAELHINNVDLSALATEATEALMPRLSALNVEVQIGPLPSMPCDRVLVRQVFLNLISNAMKYNDKQAKWIRVGSEIQNGKRVIFVQDNGIGVAKQFYQRIFRIFKRLHAQDKYEGGTGVGLSIVKKIVERHGGEIWIESQEGEGTTFFFTLA